MAGYLSLSVRPCCYLFAYKPADVNLDGSIDPKNLLVIDLRNCGDERSRIGLLGDNFQIYSYIRLPPKMKRLADERIRELEKIVKRK